MTQDQISHARAAIAAKAAYWDALREFEVMTTGRSGEWTDSVNDRVCEVIDHMAVCAGNTADNCEYITDTDIEIAFVPIFRGETL